MHKGLEVKPYLVKANSRSEQPLWCLPLLVEGAAYAASGAWRAYGRASHALCLAGSPMG